ncbi:MULTISPECIES: hypothetical protein [Sphingomonas]|uniref:hypothetical protein n=1 Tax=Sphingomonas TaxID=13687 RepID=UPI0012698BB7|nr:MULTISPECIES: hypothetical protein [Sphingomonas]
MITQSLSNLWAKWQRVVDWAKPNTPYLHALLSLILFVMTLIGLIAPETATGYRDFTLNLFGLSIGAM